MGGSPEQTVGEILAGEIMRGASVSARAEMMIDLYPGTTELSKNEQFLFMLQEFYNNCAEKRCDYPIKVAAVVQYHQPTDVFIMAVVDNVPYPPEEVKRIVESLNSSHPVREGKNRPETEDDIGWMWIPRIRQVLEAWGGGLEYKTSEDHRVAAVATWKKTAMETVELPQMSLEEL
jgi:hypothetical protein